MEEPNPDNPFGSRGVLSGFRSLNGWRDGIPLAEKSSLADYDSREGFSHFYIKNSGLL
jgi:hypothetical protein